LNSISWRLATSVGVILAAVVLILPSIKPMWPHKKINLGLDLQGGMHLVLEVETDKAVEGNIDRICEDMKSLLRKGRIRFTRIERIKGERLEVQLGSKEMIDPFDTFLNKEYPELREKSRDTDAAQPTFVYDLPEKQVAHIKTMAEEQALETIRNRIDQFGVSEPDIRREGTNRILVQLPGVVDAQRAKSLIGQTALLEFKLVDDNADIAEAKKGQLPPGTELLYKVDNNPDTGRTSRTPFVVYKHTLLTGSYVTDARVQIDSRYNEPYVTLDFDKKGAEIFSTITEDNVNKRLAVVLDNKIQTAPVIQEKISGGHARITGRFSTDEAHDLAIVLRAGALPAPVKVLEERTVGPSLGADSIHKGILSTIVAGILVIVFMALYYRLSGVIADVALTLNILLIGAGLAALGATLTLPGIAGVILTIGMAVDSNVLIFERIREELRIGKMPMAAVDAGFERATLTILDANVTTLIAALVLFQFGTGPVKGFAVTLSLGVISSLFTALVFSRYLFDLLLTKRKVKQLSI
jgi:preprotein translocase subunit SecD